MGGRNIGPKIAAILSIFETCKRVQINLRAYPNDVHPKLPACPISKVADFSPLRWRSV